MLMSLICANILHSEDCCSSHFLIKTASEKFLAQDHLVGSCQTHDVNLGRLAAKSTFLLPCH